MLLIEKLERYSNSDINAIESYTLDYCIAMSYSDLWVKSERLATYFLQNLRPDKSPIIVYGHKHPLMIVAFLAAVRSGHPYCPLDTNMPPKRVDDILTLVQPQMVIAVEQMYGVESQSEVMGFDLLETLCEDERCDGAVTFPELALEDIFYILFTSGSTGVPKGVQISYGNINAFLQWSQGFFDGREGVRFLNQAPFSFDLSVMELYSSLYTGGTLVALGKDIQASYQDLIAYLKRVNLQFWVSTPSFANMCLVADEFSEALLPGLEVFWFCGETLPHATASQLRERFPKAKVYNTYGPTESTVAVTSILIDEDVLSKWNPLPIGKPKTGTQLFLGDAEALENDLSSDELVITGDTVAQGYFRNEEQTQRAFGCRLTSAGLMPSYRTGDKAYWQDGLLFYQGRIDLQLKLHGFRIEIEDIEKNLHRVDGVLQAAIHPNYTADQTVQSLTAFIVYGKEIENKFKTIKVIKDELAEYVPAYMVPKKILFLESLPMTVNGKVDRKALKELNS